MKERETSMAGSLTGKTALITGSTSGIGRAVAEEMAAAGANVVLNGFGPAEEIEALRQALAADNGVAVSYSPADMSRPGEIAAMIEVAKAEHGELDILVNNAGIQHVAPIEDFPTERWDAVLAINLSSCFHTTRLVLPGMRARGWGRIINIASAHGLVASLQKAAYVAAKHGVVGLTKVTALETAGSGITCNAICPGWVLTPLLQKQIDAHAAEKGLSEPVARRELVGAKMPSEECVTTEQVAALALFLCSPAADGMTGAPIPIDGAWTAQ
jgi:3-hydroxybutyrate dehydrogenase